MPNENNGDLGCRGEGICEGGFWAATVEDIAVESEYSVGTLYNTIGNKESILGSLVLRISSMAMAAQPKVSAKVAVVPELEQLFRFYVDFWYCRKEYLRLVRVFESPDIQQRAKPRQSYSEMMFNLIKAGQRSGEIRPDASGEKLAVIFFGFPHSFLQSIDAPLAMEASRRRA